MTELTELEPWQALARHALGLRNTALLDLFATDAGRQSALSFEAAGVFMDLSKNRIDRQGLELLCDLARARDLRAAIAAMFAGEKINTTEGRAVLHVALRAPAERVIEVDGRNVVPEVYEQRRRLARFVDAVRSGEWRGATGVRIKDVVNIGIGGSDLGPRMVTTALWPYHGDVRVHFVANLDGSDLSQALAGLAPESTLFIVASKTFTTLETMTNAQSARRWLLAALGDAAAVARHFVALSTNMQATAEFGIPADNVFAFWDWVGGRFSVWSVIGLAVAIAVGNQRFDELLDGARAMDEHFESAPLAENLPVLLALIGIWYRNFFGRASHAVLPYDDGLRSLPAYLQQAEMESNGKGVTRAGRPTSVTTAPVVWGGVGSNSQHAFFQQLHQGPEWVPIDFIAALAPQHGLRDHHEGLLANCFAQSEALMAGEPDAADPQRRFPGNRPSTTLLVDRLTPERLGALLALYEHKIFVQGRVWGINSFDQFGVELGKRLAGRVGASLAGGSSAAHDPSTRALIHRFLRQK